MKGGGHEEDVALIRKFLVPIPANLIEGNQDQKYQYKPLSDFLDGIVPREPDMRQFTRMLKEYPISPELGQRLQATLTEVNTAKIRRPGTLGQPFLLSLAQRFQSELAEILPIVIANPPARKANIDWFPSLQKLHRISRDYASFRAPTQGARINAKFDRVDTASKKDARDKRPDEAERKLLESTGEFSDGILSTWFDRVRRLVDVPSPFREQAIADIWALVPRDMPSGLTAELHSIFDRHTAFLSAKELDVPLAPPLVAPEAKPDRPGRKVRPEPRPDEPLAAAAVPLPVSAPGSPAIEPRGELQAEPKELLGPAPLLEAPVSQAISAPPPRRGERPSKSVAPLAGPATNPASLLTGQSSAAAPIASPPPQPRVVSEYTAADVPGPTVLERGAVPASSDRTQLPARVEGEVPVHEPLPELAEGQAPPARVPVKQPGLLDGLSSMIPSFLSSPAPTAEVNPAAPLPAVSQPGRADIPEYTAQPGPSTASQLPLPPPTRFNPLDRTFTPPAPKAYNPFQSYAVPPLASVTSGPLASPGTSAPFSFLTPGTQPPNTGLSTQTTPATSEEQKAFLKGPYQSIDKSKSVCERTYPTLYRILQTGTFNGKSVFTMLSQQDPDLAAFFAEIQFDVGAKTLMGHPIPEVYKACHPDREVADPNLTTIFQVLQALYNYTGARQPIQSVEDVDPDDESYWADDDPRWDEDKSDDFLKQLIASIQIPRKKGPSLDEVLASIRNDQNLKEIQIQNRKDYIKKHITTFIRQTSERCTDRVLAMRREANMNKLMIFLVEGYPFRVSADVIRQIKDIIHDEPGKGMTESKTLRFFLDNVVKVIQARNIQELNQRLVAIRQVIHAIFLQEQWCAKPNVALDVRQELYRGSLKAKWIDTTKQGLTLTSDPIRPDKAGGIPSKTITISRGDCFSFNPDGVRTCAPKYIFKESKNHFTVENITEVPTGYTLSILQYLSGSVVRSSRFPILLDKASAITCFVNGIIKKDCPAGVGLTPQTPDLPNDCPKKLLNAQLEVVGLQAKARNNERRATTCEENLKKVKAELEAALAANAAETAKLQGDLGVSKEALRRMEGVKNGLETDLARTNRALATIRDMLGEQSRKLGALNTRYETLDKQKVKLEGQLTAEQGKSAGLEAANAEEQGRLRASLADITGKLGQVTDERGILQREIDRQRGELEKLEREAADLETQFASTKALIVQKGDEIRRELAQSVAHIDSGLNIIQEGVQDVSELVIEAKEQIGLNREAFGRQMAALQRELEQKNLQGRQEVLANIGALRAENQQALGALNAGLAAALAESARLNELLRTETAAKAQAQGALQAAQAAAEAAAAAQARELAAAREASERAFADFKAASETASAEERQRLIAEAHLAMEELGRVLKEEQAVAVAAANEAARAQVEAQLAALREQIAALPPPYVPPPPLPPQPVPIITGRTPAGPVAPGSNIQIQWDPHGTVGPWILKIFYDGVNPDFKDIQVAGDITYLVKQSGALTGQIFSIV
jgi:hypothetical protein